MVNQALLTSNSAEWETPKALFNDLNQQFSFNLDCAAQAHNAKCERWLVDGFQGAWLGRCFLNPPYGRVIGSWMARANDQLDKGLASIVVALVPARVDTRWWQDECAQHPHKFIRGRLKFELNGIAGDAAPFPSAIVYMGL